MSEQAWDRLLIRLALLAPLLLVALSKWQDSLINWYVPWEDDTRYFGASFAPDVLASSGMASEKGAVLTLVVDEDCPCTRATLVVLQSAMAESSRQDLHLVVQDVRDSVMRRPEWARVLQQIPATPTLIITEGQRLVYAGPVNSGNLCTTQVRNVLGLAALESTASGRPVINWLEKGCYCPVRRQTT